ncbi:MAG TPA: aspartate aminotransferase family protein [Candidatus Xenobia bacterium]
MSKVADPAVGLTQEVIDRTIESTFEHCQHGVAICVRKYMGDAISVEAEGCYITSEDGSRYLDFNAMQGVANLGHRNPEVVAAVTRQLNVMPQHAWWRFHSVAQAELCELLAQVSPGNLTRSSLFNAATEAIEAALRTSRAMTGRKRYISCLGSFHGNTLGSLSVCGIAPNTAPLVPLLPCDRIPYGDFEAFNRIASREHSAFIIEPVQSTTHVMPPDDFFPKVRARCDELGIHLIADETVSCLGRSGRLFGMDHSGIAPDFLIMGKGFSGGVIGASACLYTEAVAEFLLTLPYMFHGSTFGGNELACVAAKTAIDITLRDRIPQRVSELSSYFRDGLQAVADEFPSIIKRVHVFGFYGQVDFFDVLQTAWVTLEMHRKHKIIFYVIPIMDFNIMEVLLQKYLKDQQPPDPKVAASAATFTRFKLMPPLVAGREEFDRFFAGLRSSLTTLSHISPEEFAKLAPELEKFFFA